MGTEIETKIETKIGTKMETKQVVSVSSTGNTMSNESFITFLMVGVLLALFGIATLFVPNFYQPQNTFCAKISETTLPKKLESNIIGRGGT